MSRPPFDCVPCETKVVLDGGAAARLIECACEAQQHFFNKGGTFSEAGFKRVIHHLNFLETQAIQLHKIVLEEIHYTGELPPHLEK